MTHAILRAFGVEGLKIRRSPILPVTIFILCLLLPAICGLTMLIIMHPEIAGKSTAIKVKADLAATSADWPQFFNLLSEAAAIGGLIVFGFMTTWVFGREFVDHTVKDILALPIPRSAIVGGKLLALFIWCAALDVGAYLVGIGVGAALGLPLWSTGLFLGFSGRFFLSGLLTILLGAPVSYVASAGRGYLPSLAFVIFSMVAAQLLAAAGLGAYFPWSIPGLLSGAAGPEGSALPAISYVVVPLTALLGVAAVTLQWEYADQAR
jgi:ABC-2 type transport system permease protein